MARRSLQGPLAALALALVLASVALLPADARMTGVSGRSETGCICHGGGTEWEGAGGMLAITPTIEGVPEMYEPLQTYELTIYPDGGPPYTNAGFDLNASAGTLSVPDGETNVQITTEDTFGGVAGEATHITPASRSWRVDWTAPREGAGQVRFTLAINSVSGDQQPNDVDLWTRTSATSEETNLPPVAPALHAPESEPTALNVSWDRPTVADLVEIQVHGGSASGFTPGDGTLLATLAPTVTRTRLENLTDNATYYLRLRVVDLGGLTADSGEQAVTLPPAPVQEMAVEESKGLPGPAFPLAVVALGLGTLWRRRRG